MVLYKFGEDTQFSSAGFRTSDSIKQDTDLHDRVLKFAAEHRKIAPKAEDFLYFTAIMMHAAERALYDEDGNLMKNADGTDVEGHWDINEKTGSWKWNCSNPNIRVYKNKNGDIFPESELKKAYKHWIGKPLCKDHQSSSVDGVRGFIVDTYWDEKYKRIIALCALDKITYPDLARKVATGYLNCVSMGVAVGAAICYDCGKVAHTENEYCSHMKNKTTYGEINTILQPIELSLVVNGADTKATVLEVLAAARHLEDDLKKVGTIDINRIKEVKNELAKLAQRTDEIEHDILSTDNDNNLTLRRTAQLSNQEYVNDLDLIKSKMSNIEAMIKTIAKNLNMEDLMSSTKTAYFQGTEEPTPGKTQYAKEEADKIRNTQDSHMKLPLTNLGPVDGIPPEDMEKKKMLARATIEERRALRAEAVERAQSAIKTAYPQGTEEPPKGGYPKDPGAKIRDTEFKINNNIGTTGLMDDDEKIKKELSRASLKARLVKASNTGDNKWEIIDTADNKVVMSASFDELTGKKPALYSSVASDSFAKEMMKTIRNAGVQKASELYKSAQELTPPPVPAGEPAPAADMPAGDPGEAAPAEAPAGPVSVDSGALKEVADTLSEVSAKLADMVGGKGALGEEAEGLQGAGSVLENPEAATEQALADLTGGAPKAATESLNTLRIVLNAGLKKAFKKNIKGLTAAKEELELLQSTAKNNSISPEFLANISKDAIEDANKIMKKSRMLQAAFVKYAKGTLALEKRAAMETRMRKMAQQTPPATTTDVKPGQTTPTPEAGKAPQTDAEKAKRKEEVEKFKKDQMDKFKETIEKAAPKVAADESTIETRKEAREKLAATVESKSKLSEMIGKAHPKSDTKLGDIATTNEAVVEGIDTIHEDMMATVSHEPKVKKAAEQLDSLIKAGKINVNDLDTMVKEGLDKETVNYWKKYFGQVDGGSEFAAGMVKEFEKGKAEKKAAEDLENYKAKYAKAYDLSYDMAAAGLINSTNSAIKAEAEKIVNYNDDAYASLQRVVAHHKANMKKTASVQVGVALDSENVTTQADGSLYDELVSAFSGKRY